MSRYLNYIVIFITILKDNKLKYVLLSNAVRKDMYNILVQSYGFVQRNRQKQFCLRSFDVSMFYRVVLLGETQENPHVAHSAKIRSTSRTSGQNVDGVMREAHRLFPVVLFPPPPAITGQYDLWFIDKIGLIEGNAKLTCKGTLRHVFIGLSPKPPPPHTVQYIHTCIQFTCSQREGRRVEPERRGEGQQGRVQ